MGYPFEFSRSDFNLDSFYFIEDLSGNSHIGQCIYASDFYLLLVATSNHVTSKNRVDCKDIKSYTEYKSQEELDESIKNRNQKVKGVSKDEPIVTNDQGGKQSKSLYRLDLVPPLALLKVGEELSKGLEHYPPDNWKLISIEDHLNHALIHLYAWIAGDKSDDHLSHATCRLLFATDLEEKNKQ